MSKNLKIQLELSAKDNASNAVKAATQAVEKGLKHTGQAADQASKTTQKANQAVEHGLKATGKAAVESGKAQVQASQQAGKATQAQQRIIQQASTQMRSNAQALARARETLGVRSERVIQREILQSQLAYQRLARSGSASANELKRAWASHQQQLRTLNAEMGKMSFGEKMGQIGRGVAGAAAGVITAGAMAKPKMMNAADYHLQLAYIADTGYSGKSNEEKQAGKQKIHDAVKASVTQYGGTKEDVVGAISELMSKGKVSVDDALALLPTIQMNATATGASSEDITKLVNSALGAGIKREEMAAFLDYASASGKAGGFELKDFAQYAPQILSAAGNAGLKGMEDMKSLFKYIQQTYNVSGGASETSTNVVNFLSKLKSADLKKKVEDIEYFDPKSKKVKQIDFTGSMIEYQQQGFNVAESFMKIVDKILASDKTYQKMLTELANAKTEDRQAVAEKIAKYVEGTKVGEIMPDLQAGAALFAIRNDKETASNVNEQYEIVDKDKGKFNQASFDFIRQENAVKFQIAKNNLEMAEIENFNKVNDVAGKAADELSRFAGEHSALTSAFVGAKDAVQILGTAALAASASLALLGGNNKLLEVIKKATLGRGAATVATTVANGATSTATGASTAASRFAAGGVGKFAQGAGAVASRAAGVLALGGAVQFLGEARTEQEIRQEMKRESPEAKKENDAKAKFYQATFKTPSDSVWTKAGQQFVPKNAEPSKPTAPLYGGYALADIAQNQRLADIRRERGLISPDAYATRSLRNQLQIEDLKSPEKGLLNPYQRAGEDTRELIQGITSPMRQELLPSFEKFDQSLGDYRSEFGVFGSQMHDNFAQIGDSIQAMMNQNHTIENHISVNLDGRVVAENTSQHLFNFANRGVS